MTAIITDKIKKQFAQQILDEFSNNVSEDFHQVMSSDSQLLQPTQVTVMSEKVIKSNGINAVLDVVDSK